MPVGRIEPMHNGPALTARRPADPIGLIAAHMCTTVIVAGSLWCIRAAIGDPAGLWRLARRSVSSRAPLPSPLPDLRRGLTIAGSTPRHTARRASGTCVRAGEIA
jgi:hypothetical protein